MNDPVAIGGLGRRLAEQAAAAEEEARYDEARSAYTEAIACLEEGVRRFPDDVGLNEALIDLLQRGARLFWLLGGFAQQAGCLEQALACADRLSPGQVARSKRISILLDRAGNARDLGRYQEALIDVREALRLCDERGDSEQAGPLAERSRLLILRAEVLLAMGDGGAGLTAAEQACQAARQEIGAHGETPWRLRRLAQTLRLQGAAGLAEYVTVSARAMALARERLTESGAAPASGPARDLVWMTLQYAEALRLAGEPDTALIMAKRAVILCDRALGEAPEQLNFPYMKGLALKTAGGALVALGDPLGAEEQYRAAADAFGVVLARIPTSLDELKERCSTWQALGDLLAQQQRPLEADECHRLALQDREALRAIAPGLNM